MSKGGSQKTEVKIPEWLEMAAQDALRRGSRASQVGYMPWMGPDVAAMMPQQLSAMEDTNAAASAFGMGTVPPTAGMGQPQTFAGGVQGYSSFPLYNQAVGEWKQRAPKQFNQYNSLFRG